MVNETQEKTQRELLRLRQEQETRVEHEKQQRLAEQRRRADEQAQQESQWRRDEAARRREAREKEKDTDNPGVAASLAQMSPAVAVIGGIVDSSTATTGGPGR